MCCKMEGLTEKNDIVYVGTLPRSESIYICIDAVINQVLVFIKHHSFDGTGNDLCIEIRTCKNQIFLYLQKYFQKKHEHDCRAPSGPLVGS